MAKKRKNVPKFDGLSGDDLKKLRTAIRQVWRWSVPHRLTTARCIGADGFSYCEQCKKRAPKVFIDHITPCGKVDGGFIERTFCPSSGLQGLCKKCHQPKTNQERRQREIGDFF